MALTHAAPGEVVDLSTPAALAAEGRTRALFKTADLEVIHLVLRAGKGLPPHRVAGDITIHCLSGLLDVTVPEGVRRLAPQQLLHVQGDGLHALVALADATALVTVALRPAGTAR